MLRSEAAPARKPPKRSPPTRVPLWPWARHQPCHDIQSSQCMTQFTLINNQKKDDRDEVGRVEHQAGDDEIQLTRQKGTRAENNDSEGDAKGPCVLAPPQHQINRDSQYEEIDYV